MDGIVVGVDRSAAGVAALEWGLAEGVRRGLPVTAVHSWSDLVSAGLTAGGTLLVDPVESERLALDTAQDVLKEATAKVPGVDAIETSAIAPRGGAAALLAEASKGAELVVVGTRSASALSRAVLGSVSASVLHHAACPVVVVPEPGEPGDRPRRVIVGVDHSPAAKAALDWAARHAAETEAVLVPVYVREPSFRAQVEELSLPELEAHERAALESAVPADLGVRVEPEVVCGHAAAELMGLAQPQDLIVLGSRGRGGFTGMLLGSTSTAVAQHAHCPVVVLRQHR